MDDRIPDGYVVIGGGVCGCLLAHELATRTGCNVGIIESGGEQFENATDRSRPGRWLHLLGSSDDEAYVTEPIESLAGRRVDCPRGRGLGGSGRINAMIWMPPHSQDWQMLSAAGFSSDELQSSLELAERRIASERPRSLSDSSGRFLRSMNGQTSSGQFAAYRRINQNGRRWTTECLLDELKEHAPDVASRIKVFRGSVHRMVTRKGQVESIELASADRLRSIAIGASAQVVSCAGAIGTPRVLFQSGIGDANELQELGIDPVLDLPAVGQGLHDHLIMPVVYKHSGEPFLSNEPTMQDLARWQHGGTGSLASNIAECGGFDPSERFQWHVTPTDYLRYPNASAGAAMTLGVSLTRPRSRGRVAIVSDSDSSTGLRLSIDPNYLSDQNDVTEMVEGVRLTRRLANQLNESGMHLRESVPGQRRQSDEQLAASIARYSQTLYHPGGTCAVGAVVDADFRVRGISNLSIVDASILPEPTVANPTAVLATLTCLAASHFAAGEAR